MPVFEHDGLALHFLDEGGSSEPSSTLQHGHGRDASQPAGVFSPLRAIRLLDLALRCAFPGGAMVLTSVSDAGAVLGAREVAGLHIGSSATVVGRVSLI
jgi:hypothetical protein